jgi:hypothetical protein
MPSALGILMGLAIVTIGVPIGVGVLTWLVAASIGFFALRAKK